MYSFQLTFHNHPSDLIQKAQNAITRNGGQFIGDTSKGSFVVSTPLGNIEGTYVILGQIFYVNITDKPFFVSGKMIEEQVQGFVN